MHIDEALADMGNVQIHLVQSSSAGRLGHARG